MAFLRPGRVILTNQNETVATATLQRTNYRVV